MIELFIWAIIGACLVALVSVLAERPEQREVDLGALGRPEVSEEPVHVPDSRPCFYKGNRRRR